MMGSKQKNNGIEIDVTSNYGKGFDWNAGIKAQVKKAMAKKRRAISRKIAADWN